MQHLVLMHPIETPSPNCKSLMNSSYLVVVVFNVFSFFLPILLGLPGIPLSLGIMNIVSIGVCKKFPLMKCDNTIN